MKLLTKKLKINLTNKDFKIDSEFTIEAEALSQSEMMDLYNKDNKEISLAKGVFINSIKSWSGFKDEDDKVIECNEENKRVIFENNEEFGALVVEKIMEEADNFKKKLLTTSTGKKPVQRRAKAVSSPAKQKK